MGFRRVPGRMVLLWASLGPFEDDLRVWETRYSVASGGECLVREVRLG